MEILKKHLLKSIQEQHVINDLYITLTKQEVLSMSREEIALAEEFAKEYHRKRYRLRPRSFKYFLSDPDYEENCTVTLWIPFEELIKRGILTLNEENGKTYWYLYGEKLDPKTYEKLYMRKREAFRTLLEELGMREFMDKFDIEPTPALHPPKLFSFDYHGLSFDMEYHHEYRPIPTLVFDKGNIVGSENQYTEKVSVKISVRNPRVDDVYKIENLVRELKTDVETKINKLINWIKKSCNIRDEDISFHGDIQITDYKINTYLLSIDGHHQSDKRTRFNVDVYYIYPQTLDVSLSRTVISQYLVNTLRMFSLAELDTVVDNVEYRVSIDTLDKFVTLRSEGKYVVDPNLENLPDISRDVNTIMNMNKILYEFINKNLEEIKNIELKEYKEHRYYGTGIKIEDLMNIVDWKANQTPEEAVLKTWLLRVYLESRLHIKIIEPDVLSIFISLAYLGGAPYEYLLDKANEGLDYVIKLAHRGRLRITENGIYLDGKKLNIKTNDKYMELLMEIINVLLSNEEESTKTKHSYVYNSF